MREPSPLLVFADDWGRHPSSCQHLMRCLLGSHDVYWVNTIGTRSPRLDLATLSRALEKVWHWVRPGWGARRSTALPPGLRVVNPRMWPWFGSRFSRWLNRALLRRQLTRLIRNLPSPPVVVTTLPIVADLVGELPVRRWVYYCVDDFGQWPGLDQLPLRRMDDQLIARADVRIAVSETLRDRIRSLGQDAHLLTHGVDVQLWADAGPAPALEGLKRPLVVFWGVVDRRMDVSFVRRLASELTSGTVVLAGPRADPDRALLEPANVVSVGALPFEQLPGLAREASVLVMPYADLPVTRAMQPLKLKEYLATGKPVVVRDLPANREWHDCLDLVNDPQSFAERVLLRARTGVPPEQAAARQRLARESWLEKARLFERFAGLDGDHVAGPTRPGILNEEMSDGPSQSLAMAAGR
jgi:glycosyltransferase involved in cell wall biosynthesis